MNTEHPLKTPEMSAFPTPYTDRLLALPPDNWTNNFGCMFEARAEYLRLPEEDRQRLDRWLDEPDSVLFPDFEGRVFHFHAESTWPKIKRIEQGFHHVWTAFMTKYPDLSADALRLQEESRIHFIPVCRVWSRRNMEYMRQPDEHSSASLERVSAQLLEIRPIYHEPANAILVRIREILLTDIADDLNLTEQQRDLLSRELYA